MKGNSIPQKILMVLGDLLEFGTNTIWDYNKLREKAGIKYMYFPPRPLFYRGLSNLKKSKFIEAKAINNKKEIYLTKKGKIELIKYKIKFAAKEIDWDGKYRGVCWDIPEISRKDRDYIRTQLRWLGLKELQKSLWLTPFPIEKELIELINLYNKNLIGDIRFLTIEKIENDKDLRKYFNLS